MDKTYLGDGLYADDYGYQVTLTAPRQYSERISCDHYVCLDDSVLQSFFRFIERKRNVIITVTTNEKRNENGNDSIVNDSK